MVKSNSVVTIMLRGIDIYRLVNASPPIIQSIWSKGIHDDPGLMFNRRLKKLATESPKSAPLPRVNPKTKIFICE